jgi:hypothetical protein
VIGGSTMFLKPLITDPAADEVISKLTDPGSKTQGWVRFARSAS